MSIYAKGFGFKFGVGKAKKIAIAGIAVLFVVFALYSLAPLLSQTPLEARFEQNPWLQSEKDSILLFVKVSNTTGSDVQNAMLEVRPKSEALIVFPQTASVDETLAPGDSRLLAFNIRKASPSSSLNAGNYTMELKLALDSKIFSSSIVLEVK